MSPLSAFTPPRPVLSGQEYRRLAALRLRWHDDPEVRAPYSTPQDLVRLRFYRWLRERGWDERETAGSVG
ncbi:MAG TPA: hypothetical protein VFE42_20755 [Chloroflexota bacterium]|nr:hypothetical protein [Chloroflexota bacterium]HZS89909.1 hypothetical protein [Chloroflexota bacterium]